jgi:YHS domain-containing protein
MKNLLVTALLLGALFACDKRTADPAEENAAAVEQQPGKSADPGPAVTCPFCGLTFGRDEAVGTETYQGQTYYFLLKDHREAFAEAPDRYLTGSRRAGETATTPGKKQ